MNEPNKNKNVTPEDAPVHEIVPSNPADSALTPESKHSIETTKKSIFVLRYTTNGFDFEDALLHAGFSQSNLRMAKKRMMEDPWVKSQLKKLWHENKGYVKHLVCNTLHQVFEAHSKRAEKDVNSAVVTLKFGIEIAKLFNLYEEEKAKNVTLDQLIDEARES